LPAAKSAARVLVMLDLKMPKAPALKADPGRGAECLSGERDLAESYERGVNAYVVKPVEFEKFINAVKQLVVPDAAERAPALSDPCPCRSSS
jgi:uncharacterized protein YecA (UPF0149 family)